MQANGGGIYRTVLDQIPVPTIILTYPSLAVQYLNLAAARLVGDDATTLEQCKLPVTRDDIERAHTAFLDGSDNGEQQLQLENRGIRVTMCKDEGSLNAVVQIDHTDLAADYRALYDSLPLIVSQKTEVDMFHNREYFDFTGQDREKEDSSRYLDAVHPEDREAFTNALFSENNSTEHDTGSRVDETPLRTSHAHRLRSSTGEYRWVKTEALSSGNKRTLLTFDVHEIYLQARDSTEKESMLQRQRQENQRLLDGESIAKEGNRLKGEFLANTSHEIRTPIAGVIGMVDLLLDTELDSEQTDYAESIRSSADALLTVINDVLDFSKIEAGKMQIDKHPFELTQMIRDLETMLSFMTAKKGLGLDVQIDPGTYYLIGDRGRVRQILTNLLSNAIKFTQQGTVSLKVAREEETAEHIKVRFSITDTGSGMTEHTLKNLFRPFAQGDAGRTYGGTGLGLSICKKLIELLYGEIGTETELGRGTTFWFWLNFARARPEAMSRKSSTTASSLSNNQGETGRTYSTSQQQNEIMASPAPSTATISSTAESSNTLRRDRDTSPLGSEEYPPRIRSNEAFVNPSRPAMLERGESTSSVITLRGRTEEEGLKDEETGDGVGRDEPATRTDTESLPGIGGDFGFRGRHQSENGSVTGSARSEGSSLGFVPFGPGSYQEIARLSGRAPSVTAISTSVTSHAPKDKRILLAEDNDINCKIATSMLQKLGYECVVVKNGQQAVDAIDEQSSFDLILMDVQMPVMNGYDATALIRKSPNESMRTIPVIALTASAVSGDREKCIAAGMDDYLTKPVNKKNLEKKLQKWLDV